jgi:glycosyltransferase involved in cell wall biosynthesis/anti-sigma regulatory factor (Ser/Thr protein kinase)
VLRRKATDPEEVLMTAELARTSFGPATATLEFDYAGDRALGRRGLRPPQPRVSVVVPAKDEAANILEVLPYLSSFFEVIVVVSEDDDASAEAALAALPSARVVYQTRKGKGNALACGFSHANGDVIVTFDVDGSADPHEIPRFVEALTRGADLAKGSRFCPGGGSQDITQFRSLGNYGLNLAASALTGTRFTDLCYGFNAFWADQLPVLCLPDTAAEGPQRGDGFEIEAMIIGRFAISHAIIIEVPSYEYDRYHGESNLNAIRDGFRVLWTLLRDRVRSRRYRALASRLRASGNSVGKPFWMLANPRTRALEAVAGTDFSAEVQRTLENAWANHPRVPEATRMEVAIAAAEISSNIVDHAGRGRDVRAVMRLWVLADEVRIEFTDDGAPAEVDLATLRMPDVMAENGRGLAIARASLHELSYHRDELGNHWTLVSRRFGLEPA